MEAVYSKIKDMLKAFYPVLYLTSFEYDRTKQKIEGIINVLRSEGKDVRIFNWNCVDGLRGLNGDKPQPVINKDGEEIVEVGQGDVIYTIDAKHYIENTGDEELVFLAVVINL